MRLELDDALLTKGPPTDIITFLADDPPTVAAATPVAATPSDRGSPREPLSALPTARAASAVPRTSSDGGLASLQKLRSAASRIDSGVSELWTVDFRELAIEKQIGEGSFGKVGVGCEWIGPGGGKSGREGPPHGKLLKVAPFVVISLIKCELAHA
jgi:hypothetical protein